jgi:hypothetical protein
VFELLHLLIDFARGLEVFMCSNVAVVSSYFPQTPFFWGGGGGGGGVSKAQFGYSEGVCFCYCSTQK